MTTMPDLTPIIPRKKKPDSYTCGECTRDRDLSEWWNERRCDMCGRVFMGGEREGRRLYKYEWDPDPYA